MLIATDVFAPEPWPTETWEHLGVRDLEQLVADATEEINRRRSPDLDVERDRRPRRQV